MPVMDAPIHIRSSEAAGLAKFCFGLRVHFLVILSCIDTTYCFEICTEVLFFLYQYFFVGTIAWL